MYLKSLSLVKCKVPHAPMVVAEGPKFFEFNTSTLLEKALKALLTQIKFQQAFAFLLFILFRVQLDTSLFISSLFLSFKLYSLFEKSYKSLYVWKVSLNWCGMSSQLLLIMEICSFPWVKSTYIQQMAYVTFGRHYLTETSTFVQI